MKKTSLLSTIGSAILLMTTASCEDSTTAGGSLIQDEVAIVMDSTFTVSGHSVVNSQVQSRTVLQLLGNLDAKEYGSISSSIVTQYMPAAALDTTDVKAEYIDSVKLVMRMAAGGFIGDSIVPMKVTAYELTRSLPSPIYSSFNPDGYYNSSSPIGSTVYSALIDGQKGVGADANGTIYKEIAIDLPREFGVNLFNRFKNNPETFDTPQSFASWFPGMYITTTFGSGRVARILSNIVNVYYRSVTRIPDTTRDTTLYLTGAYMGVTPEIITNNNITYDMAPSLKTMADNGNPILVAPTGYDIEFRFPAREIIRRYKENSGRLAVINTLTFRIPVEEIENDYDITVPPYILMVKKSKKDEFFAKSQLTDNVSSFYAQYDVNTRSYYFSGMRDYILDLLSKDEITDEDTDFVITPVLVSFYSNNSSSSSYYYYYYYYQQSSQQVNTISPYVTEPVMAKFNFDKAKIKFTYSKQTTKN